MKRIIGIIGMVIILFGTFLVTPSLAMSCEEVTEGFEIRFLLVIGGRININFEEKRLNGFGLIVYTDGEVNYFEDFSIYYKGIPIFVTSTMFISHCFYIPADI